MADTATSIAASTSSVYETPMIISQLHAALPSDLIWLEREKWNCLVICYVKLVIFGNVR